MVKLHKNTPFLVNNYFYQCSSTQTGTYKSRQIAVSLDSEMKTFT